MAEMRVIRPPKSSSPQEVIDFVLNLLQFCKDNRATSVGFCVCYDGDDGIPFINADYVSIDPADQENFETAALELRFKIIDSVKDWIYEIDPDEE